ncbi:LYR motif-containing protein 4 [Folsomia candida]|uniref:LYR motif-containing protein 4 n=1 Tax=Folsomia candida TaxID=158441 RepID=UPI000B8EFC8F|nr:LYR motif-containing protein 4 [Folsomia candida]
MASTGAGKHTVLHMYKAMLRESEKFSSYNYRNYALRRIRDAFKENKNLQDKEKIKEQMSKANKNLSIIKRQVIIGDIYRSDKLIIEQK